MESVANATKYKQYGTETDVTIIVDEDDIRKDVEDFAEHEMAIIINEGSDKTFAEWAEAFKAMGIAVQEYVEQIARACAILLDQTVMDFNNYISEFKEPEKKHFDAFYQAPKMQQYYKQKPNQININKNIRKARNRLR